MALTMKQSTASLRAASAPSAGRRALVCKATKYDDELIATAVSAVSCLLQGADWLISSTPLLVAAHACIATC